jgi:hypothetical protein
MYGSKNINQVMASLPQLNELPDGYPKLSAFMGKDSEYAIFRKFRVMNSRNLLYMQTELMELEARLEQYDAGLRNGNCDDLKSWRSYTVDSNRMKLVMRIRKTLATYSECCLHALEAQRRLS